MKILLIHPPAIGEIPEPPLGIGYLASYLDSQGHTVRAMDMAAIGVSLDELKLEIEAFNPKVVGVSFITPQYAVAKRCWEIAKSLSRDIITVVGGAHVSALPMESVGEKDVDFVIVGEGELTLAELVDAVERGATDFSGIKGLGYKKDGKIFINPPRELIQDLDTLPMPYWTDLAKGKYIDLPIGFDHETRYFTILTGRGCPFQCNFCASDTIFKRVLRTRSPENVFSEIRWLYDNYGARYFNFVDDTLTLKRENILALCRMIIDSGMRITWRGTSRVNAVDPEVLRHMKDAGCHLISYGIESGDPKILKLIKKNISLEQAKKAIAMTRQAGIMAHGFFMVGNLGETWDSVDRTINFMKELDADSVSCSIIVPFPGTEIYNLAKEKGWLEETDWAKFNATPHSIGYFLPVMRTEAMSREELVKAYYKVINSFIMTKIKKRYGTAFYLNPIFYRQEVFRRIRAGGFSAFISMLLKGILGVRLGYLHE